MPTFKNIPQGHGTSTLGQLTMDMYKFGVVNPNLKTISFDLRRSNLYIGSFIFIAERRAPDGSALRRYGCTFLVDYYNLIETHRGKKTNNDIIKVLSSNIKELQKEGGITNEPLQKVYKIISSSPKFNKIIEIYMNKFLELGNLTPELRKIWGYSYDMTGWIRNATNEIAGKYHTHQKVIFKDMILTYYMEASSRILKEYYKCAYPEIQERISPDKVVQHLKFPYIWMTDMYAFYRFFMKPKEPKDDGGHCKLQKNIILHGGDWHIQNLYNLITKTFNKPYELSIKAFKSNNIEVYKPLYTLNFIENGRNIKEKHIDQISELLNKSFDRNPPQREQFNEHEVSYILILKDDNVVGCFYFCEFPYANDKLTNLRQRHKNMTNGDIYIYNLAISPTEQGKRLCNYLISYGLCFLKNKFEKTMWLIAENPNHHGTTGSAAAANACYVKFMKLEPNCKNNKQNKYCYYRLQNTEKQNFANFAKCRRSNSINNSPIQIHNIFKTDKKFYNTNM